MDNMREVLSVAAGALIMLTLGSSHAISVWNADLKDALQFTQQEIAMVCGFASFGVYFSVTTGFIFDRLHSHKSILLGGGLLGLLYGALAIGVEKKSHVFSASIVSVILMLIGQCSNFGTFAALSCNESLFGDLNRGKVISLQVAAYSAGGAVFAWSYKYCFQSDIHAYFRFMSILSLAVFLCGYFALLPTENACRCDYNKNGRKAVDEREVEEAAYHSRVDVTNIALLSDEKFQLLFIIVLILVGASLFVMSNIYFVIESFQGPIHHNSLLVAMFSTGNFFGRIFTGILSDHLVNHISRIRFISIAAICTLVNQLLFLTLPADYLIIPIFLSGVTDGMVFATFPVLTREKFGSRYFAKNFGILSLANAIGYPLIFSPIGSLVYKYYANSYDPETHMVKCIGYRCFSPVFMMLGCLSYVAFVASIQFARRQDHHTI